MAMGQGLDLDPKSPTVREWTCIAATIASDGDPFNKLATRLLQVQASSEDDLARRFVMAMTLRKISKDPKYGGLSATRRSEIQGVIDSIDGASVDRIAGILGAAMVPELSDSTPWYVSRVEMPKFADLIVFLESVSVEAEEAMRECDNAAKRGLIDQGEMLAGVDVDSIVALLKSPEGIVPARTRERLLECLAVAAVEARAGDAVRLAMLGEIAATGARIRGVKGLVAVQVSNAYDTLLRQSPDAPPRATLERLSRIRQLCEHAKFEIPSPESLRLAKPLKPAHAQLAPLFRQTQKTIAPVAKRLLDADESMNDPAIMSADDAFISVLRDFESLSEISALIVRRDERGREIVRDECKFAAARLLDAVKQVARAKGDDKETRLNEFRTLVSTLKLALWIPDEQSLRSDASSEAADSLTRFVAAQREYLQSLSNPRRPRDQQTISALESGSAVLRLRARARIEDPGLLLAWPGIELSEGGLRVLLDGLESHVRDMLRIYASGQLDRLAVEMRDGESRYAAAFAVADLHAVLSRSGVARGCALDEVSAGAPDPDRVPSARHVSDFQFISLCAEEIAALRAAGADAKAIEDLMNTRARGIRIERQP